MTTFGVKYPYQNIKGLKGVSGSTKRRHHFEIPVTPMWPGFSEGQENNINVINR